jgi:hypothetical protein
MDQIKQFCLIQLPPKLVLFKRTILLNLIIEKIVGSIYYLITGTPLFIDTLFLVRSIFLLQKILMHEKIKQKTVY